VTQNNTMK